MLEKKIEHILGKYNYDFVHIKKTTSTMDGAREYLNSYKKNCIYLSDEQSKGRGQRGNIWDSPLGNIYCTISFNNILDINEHFVFSVLISLSIKETLEKFKINNIYFKWPNDIFYEKKKFAGLISEVLTIEKDKLFIIVGFGINFLSSPNTKYYSSTHIKSFCDLKSKDEFLFIFFNILFNNFEILKNGNKNQLIKIFSENLMFINKKINIFTSDGLKKMGIFRGINDNGSLQLERNDNIENIYNGRIEL